MDGSLYFDSVYSNLRCLIFLSIQISSSFSCKRVSSRCHINGFVAEIETYFSPDIKSVNSATGDRAAFTDSRTMVSCQVGIKCVVFLSSLKTIRMATSCSRIHEIILYCDPHLVGQSVTSV